MLARLLLPEMRELVRDRKLRELREILQSWEPPEVALLIEELKGENEALVFRILPRSLAHQAFEFLSPEKQENLINALAREHQRLTDLLNDLSPDDRTALFEELPGEVTHRLLYYLNPKERAVAVRLLGYPENSIGRLMTTDYVAIRPDWTVDQALRQVRRFGKDSETINMIYVVERGWTLVDELRLRELLLADPETIVSEILDGRYVALKAWEDQEKSVMIFQQYSRLALPVTDSDGVLLGIVTIDDVLNVAQEEATEDIQKMGAVEALDDPYLRTPFWVLVKKRARWLILLFFGGLLTATAMAQFETVLVEAVMLAAFIPLVIASGGNSGSQAATLITRALAVGEVNLGDWWKVARREMASGVALGVIIGVTGLLRVGLWEWWFGSYGEHALKLAFTIAISLLAVVLVGTMTGSMLPFLLKRMGADPAVSSTPFVATVVDVAGLLIYFSIAIALLKGSLIS